MKDYMRKIISFKKELNFKTKVCEITSISLEHIVKKQDEVELAKGIEKMILNYSYFDSENIKKYAENLFSIEKTTDKYLKLYKNILKSEV